MKKINNILLGALLSIGLISAAQAQSFSEGDFVINAGIGVGSVYGWTGGLGLPLGAGVEYGIKDLETGSIGIGGDFGFVTGSGLTIMTFGGRGSYYFTELFDIDNDKLDIYAGLGLYYRHWNWSGYGLGSLPGYGGMTAAFHAGARYFFADNIGGYVELGNNWAWLNVGVTFKL